MNRILVLGCAGAGKSTFARRLAEATGLPLVHLDQAFWRPGWTPPEAGAWPRIVERLIAEPRWVMDGNYAGSLPLRLTRADTVFFLDMPRRLCMSRVLRRTAFGFGRTRPDLTAGCPERFDWEFLKFVWNFDRTHRPLVLDALEEFAGEVVTFRRPADGRAFLAGLDRRAGSAATAG